MVEGRRVDLSDYFKAINVLMQRTQPPMSKMAPAAHLTRLSEALLGLLSCTKTASSLLCRAVISNVDVLCFEVLGYAADSNLSRQPGCMQECQRTHFVHLYTACFSTTCRDLYRAAVSRNPCQTQPSRCDNPPRTDA